MTHITHFFVFGYIICVSRRSQCINMKPNSSHNSCETNRASYLVEQFFNVIFNEFHHSPPSCVCVQVCPEEPTYCYPNGCFRKSEIKKKSLEEITHMPVSHAAGQVVKSVMFLVHDDMDMVTDVLEGQLPVYKAATARPLNEFVLRTNPFKELVKHKRLPKLEMKYNLREQVKNTKSNKIKAESVNLSKTRWPTNKNILLSKKQLSEMRQYKKIDTTGQSKFFASLFPESEIVNYSPKYLTKYLTKRDNVETANVEGTYLYKSDSGNFSIEHLIDSLIERNVESTSSKIKPADGTKVIERKMKRKVTRKIDDEKYKIIDDDNNIPTMDVISLTSTNESIDNNKYINNNENFYSILEVIKNMTEEIEKQNRISFDIAKKFTGVEMNVTINDTESDYRESNNGNITVTTSVYQETPIFEKSPTVQINEIITDNSTTVTSNYKTVVPDSRRLTKKKSKQRIPRKLRIKF